MHSTSSIRKKQSAHLTVTLNIHDWMGDFSVSDFQSSSRKLVWVKGSLKVEVMSFFGLLPSWG